MDDAEARLTDAARQALDLVTAVLAGHLGNGRVEELRAELHARVTELGEHLAAGVDPPRTDYGDSWENARGNAYVATEAAGAVHLELGTWSVFGRERVAALVEGDGLSEFIRLDADPRWDCELVADARALPLRAGSVDRVASNSTLEHIPHPHRVLEESHRVLRPGGVMVVAMPFVWSEHGYPEDHVRLTRGFFERVLPEIGFTDVHVDRDGSSGLYYALHQASKAARIDTRQPESGAMRELQLLVNALLGVLIPLDRYFEDGSRAWYQSVRVLARKAGTYEPSRRERRTDVPFPQRALDLLADPLTKQPLVKHGQHLACAATAVRYRVRGDSINFLEPRLPPIPPQRRLREVARRMKRRLS